METSSNPPFTGSGRNQHPGGFTLIELVAAITILGLALGGALPAASHLRDRMAVLGARESVAGIFHRARMEAVAYGGARVVLTVSPPRAELWASGILQFATAPGEELGVEMSLSGGRSRVEILLDPLGLGRVASQTIRFSRNGSEAGLVISSFARLTRR